MKLVIHAEPLLSSPLTRVKHLPHFIITTSTTTSSQIHSLKPQISQNQIKLSFSLSSTTTMADRQHPQQIQVHPQHQIHPHHQPGQQQHRYDPGSDRKSQFLPQGGPSASKVLAFLALLPVGGSLLGIAGLTFIGSLIGLALLTPLFIIFSPVLVPAALTVALAVTGFLTSGAFGLTGLSSLSWVMNYFNQATGGAAHQIDEAKRRMQDMAVYMGQKTKDVGETIQTTAQPQQQQGGK